MANIRTFLGLLLTFPLATAVAGEDRPHPEEQAIQAAITSYVEAFNKGDAAAVAGHWSEQGELVTPSGERWQGHKQLTEQFAAYFAEAKGAKLELAGTEIELESPNVASETGTARVLVPGEAPWETQYKAVHLKTAAGWKIDSVREEEPQGPPPSNFDKLQDLAWMVGKWTDASEQGQIESSCRWTTNHNFLVQSFKVFDQGRVDFEGTQIIGWDPHAQAIRSWTFDSDGGFGAGRWQKGEGRWTVQSLHVLPDGRRGSATSIYEIVDDKTIRFRSSGRQVGGELMPSIGPLTAVRSDE